MAKTKKNSENFLSRSGTIVKLGFSGIGFSTIFSVYNSLKLIDSFLIPRAPKFVQEIIAKNYFRSVFAHEGASMLATGLTITSVVCVALMAANIYISSNNYQKSSELVLDDKKQPEITLAKEKTKDLNVPTMMTNIVIGAAALVGVGAVLATVLLTSSVAGPAGVAALVGPKIMMAAAPLAKVIHFGGALFTPISLISSAFTAQKIIRGGISVVKQLSDKIFTEKLEKIEQTPEITQNIEKENVQNMSQEITQNIEKNSSKSKPMGQEVSDAEKINTPIGGHISSKKIESNRIV